MSCVRSSSLVCHVTGPLALYVMWQVLNLFLALLLNSFASDKLDENKEVRDKSKVKQGWERLKSIFKNKRIQVQPSSEEAHIRQASIANILDELKGRHGEKPSDETVITMTTEEAWAEPKSRRMSWERHYMLLCCLHNYKKVGTFVKFQSRFMGIVVRSEYWFAALLSVVLNVNLLVLRLVNSGQYYGDLSLQKVSFLVLRLSLIYLGISLSLIVHIRCRFRDIVV